MPVQAVFRHPISILDAEKGSRFRAVDNFLAAVAPPPRDCGCGLMSTPLNLAMYLQGGDCSFRSSMRKVSLEPPSRDGSK